MCAKHSYFVIEFEWDSIAYWAYFKFLTLNGVLPRKCSSFICVYFFFSPSFSSPPLLSSILFLSYASRKLKICVGSRANHVWDWFCTFISLQLYVDMSSLKFTFCINCNFVLPAIMNDYYFRFIWQQRKYEFEYAIDKMCERIKCTNKVVK